MKSTNLSIAIYSQPFMGWGGGIDFITYVANGCESIKGAKVFILLPKNEAYEDIYFSKPTKLSPKDHIKRIKKYYLNRLSRRSVDLLFDSLSPNISKVYYRHDNQGLLKALNKINADIVMSPLSSFGPNFPLPWAGYIWDFQHKYLPKFFTKQAIAWRTKVFKQTLSDAPVTIVNSRQIKNDIHKYYPSIQTKVEALPFTPTPKPEWLELDVHKMKTKYNVKDKPYFIISNQFWAHKDHATAIKAFAKFKASAKNNVKLLCTGKIDDYRGQQHIKLINRLVKENGLTNSVKLLGFIPKVDQIALMRGSLAVIQPTLYEGGPGGGSAYSAVALGVPLILSDIPINREIKEKNVYFFKAGSADGLTAKMELLFAKSPNKPTASGLQKTAKMRSDKLAKVLSKIINEAIAIHAKNYK